MTDMLSEIKKRHADSFVSKGYEDMFLSHAQSDMGYLISLLEIFLVKIEAK